MSELRKKQKQRRKEAIITAAKELIAEKGYRNTSIEEIAEKAEVGPATVYNYFNSKSGIILTVFNEEVTNLIKKGNKISRRPPERADEAVFQMISAYFGDFLARYDKKIMREILVVFLVEQLSVRKDLMRLDYTLMNQISLLLKRYIENGQIKPELNADEIVLIIYTMLMGEMMGFLVDDDTKIESFLEMLRRQISLVFQGFYT